MFDLSIHHTPDVLPNCPKTPPKKIMKAIQRPRDCFIIIYYFRHRISFCFRRRGTDPAGGFGSIQFHLVLISSSRAQIPAQIHKRRLTSHSDHLGYGRVIHRGRYSKGQEVTGGEPDILPDIARGPNLSDHTYTHARIRTRP